MKADVLGFRILIVLLKGKYNDMETRLACINPKKVLKSHAQNIKHNFSAINPYTFCNLQIKHIYTYVQGIYRAVFENSIYF